MDEQPLPGERPKKTVQLTPAQTRDVVNTFLHEKVLAFERRFDEATMAFQWRGMDKNGELTSWLPADQLLNFADDIGLAHELLMRTVNEMKVSYGIHYDAGTGIHMVQIYEVIEKQQIKLISQGNGSPISLAIATLIASLHEPDFGERAKLLFPQLAMQQ